MCIYIYVYRCDGVSKKKDLESISRMVGGSRMR